MATILAVDDQEPALDATARVLRNAGFAVWEAASGAQALELARKGPDLVLLDVQLPDIPGLEVCQRIKRDPLTTGIPVLHLTATYGASEEQAAALEGGADGYLTHPVEPIVLVATVRALLRTREAEAKARRLIGWWQSTFDAIRDGVMLLNRSGQVLRCNQAMADLVGRTSRTTRGPHGIDAVPGRGRAAGGVASGQRAVRAAPRRARSPGRGRAGSRSWPIRCWTRRRR